MTIGKAKLKQIVTEIAQELAVEQQVELVGVLIDQEQHQRYIRVYVERNQGIDAKALGDFNRALSSRLDEADPLPERYFLEVSSPGLDRPLITDEDYKRYRGREVDVRMYAPVSGKKEFTGVLTDRTDDELVLMLDKNEKEVRLPRDMVAHARLHVSL